MGKRVKYYKNEYNYSQYLRDMEIVPGHDTIKDVINFLTNIFYSENMTEKEEIEIINIIKELEEMK